MSRPSVGMMAQAACLLEATARKPGNVHRGADFADTTWLDFALSAAAIAGPLDRTPGRPLGATILEAVAATRAAVRSNTNLGMILLLAPLAAVPPDEPLRAGLARVLARTTRADAVDLYRAIRLARPGGLGRSAEGQDVIDEPTLPLVECMRLAADRDLVARQYATDFADLFDRFVPDLASALARPGADPEAAIVAAFLAFLADHPDTLIARKLGTSLAHEVSRRAALVLSAGWPDSPGAAGMLVDFDAWLRLDGHARNPGATADLAAGALFVLIREGTIPWPVPTRWAHPGFGPLVLAPAGGRTDRILPGRPDLPS